MQRQLTGNGNINSGLTASINEQITNSKYNKLTLDKFSNWYNYENQINVPFPLLEKYHNIVTAGMIRVKLNKKFHYRPEYLSYELYGTTDLWYVLMYVNEMATVTEFKTESVLIPPDSIVQTINTIIESEGNAMSGKNRPQSIKKNYLKRLDKPSEEIIKRETYEKVAWMGLPNMSSKMDNITKAHYYLSTYKSNRGWLRDEMDNLVPAIKLDSDGLTSIPSIYHTEGYRKRLVGRVNLKANTRYSLNAYMNGSTRLRLNDEITGERVIDMTGSYRHPEAMLIADLRGANDEMNVEGDHTEIVYDSDLQGKYTSHIDTSDLRITNPNLEIDIATFEAGHERDRLNASRLNGEDNLFFNLEYINELADPNIIGYNYVVNVNYEDGTKAVKEIGNENDLYNTAGELSYLKGSLVLNKGKEIKDITASVRLKVKSGVSSISFRNTLYSFKISPVNDEDLTNTFFVNEDKWYGLEVLYDYRLSDPDTGHKLYKNMSFTGIYFDPTITEVLPSGKINHLRNVDIQDIGESTNAERVNVNNPYRFGDINKYTLAFSKNINLPDKYIIDFSLTHRTKSQGGGVGFIIDFDDKLSTGYMFWISSTSQGNTSIPTFARDGNDIIMPTGFYEMDDIRGENKFIFEGDSSLGIKVSNYYPLDIEGNSFRVIKRGNRIKVFMKENNEFDTTKPILDIEDIENFHTKGELGFIAAYSEIELKVNDYVTWDTVDNYDDEEW